MLDLLVILLGLIGVLAGLRFGLRLTGAVLLVLVGSLTIGIGVGAAAAKVVPSIMGGSEYIPRAFSFTGVCLLLALFGLRYTFQRLFGWESEERTSRALDRALGAAAGIGAAVAITLFFFLVGLQIPALSDSLCVYFYSHGDSEEEGSGLFAPVVGALNWGCRALPSSDRASRAAPPLVVLTSGTAAGDFYACHTISYRATQPEKEAFALYLMLGQFILKYSGAKEHSGSPWLSHAVDTIRNLQAERDREILRQSERLLLQGSTSQIASLLIAVNVVPDSRFKRLQFEGEALKRTIEWTHYHLSRKEREKARGMLQGYLDARPSSPYRGRILREQVEHHLEQAVATVAPLVPEETGASLVREATPPASPPPPAAGYRLPSLLNDLETYRFKSAVTKGREVDSAALSPEDSQHWRLLYRQAVAMAQLHSKLLQRLNQKDKPFKIPEDAEGPEGVVTMAMEGSVVLQRPGQEKAVLKTVPWAGYKPGDMLRIYRAAVPEETEGIAAFESFFRLGESE